MISGRIKNILQILYKILIILLGVLLSKIAILVVLTAVKYELEAYLGLDFLIGTPLIMIQLSFLMFAFWGLLRLLRLNFLFSASANFTIAVFYTTLYQTIGDAVTHEINRGKLSWCDNLWVDFLILPIATFIFVIAVFILLRSKFSVGRSGDSIRK